MMAISRLFASRALPALALVLAGGCGDSVKNAESDGAVDRAIPDDYTGTFPCGNCPGIRVRLRLTDDRYYFIAQRYLADDEGPDVAAASMGRWMWRDSEGVIALTGPGPVRKFKRDGRDSLVMITESELEHRLNRDADAPAFDTSFPMTAVVEAEADGISLTECRTGLSISLDSGGEFPRFARQYRKAGRDTPVLAEIDGVFSWSDSGAPESLLIERLVSLRVGQNCRDR